MEILLCEEDMGELDPLADTFRNRVKSKPATQVPEEKVAAIFGSRRERRIAAVLAPVVLFLVINALFVGLWMGHFINHFALIRLMYGFGTFVFPVGLGMAAIGVLGRGLLQRPGGKSAVRWGIAGLLVALAPMAIRTYATHFEPERLQVREVFLDVDLPGRAAGMNGENNGEKALRILHISDIQCDVVEDYDRRAFQTMRDLKPDLILFTGDLLQPLPPATVESELPKITELLDTLHPPLGIFAVPGDTDWRVLDELRNGLGGIRLLEDSEAAVEAPGIRLRIFGLPGEESHGELPAGPSVRRWLDSTKPGDFTIVMGHAPDYVLETQDLPIGLCVAGHTHGGQIRLPFVGPLVTLSSVPRDLARGFHRVGATWLNTSAGIGCEHSAGLPDIRFNCPPEMTLITLAR